jgi:hypothetical protein
VSIAGNSYTHDCELALRSLTPFREGVVLADLVTQLRVFPDPKTWSFRLRRALLALPSQDAGLIADRLEELARPAREMINDYLEALRSRAG